MGRQRRLQDDHMNRNWSFRSNYNPCSQTRKMSIGLVADSSAKMKRTNGKGAMAELRTSQTVTSAKDISVESKHKGKEAVSPDLGTQNKAPCRESTPLVCKKTSTQNMSYSNANANAQLKIVSSLPSTINVPLQPSGNKIIGEKGSGLFFNLHSSDANEKKSNSNTYQREKESSYATPPNGPEPKKGITEQGTSERGNTGPVTLRLKVQELLETVCSPDKKEDNSEAFGMDVNNVKLKTTTNKDDSPVATNGHHFNTKETNSGSVDHKIMRPLTRSLTRKKPQALKSELKEQTPFYRSEQAQRDENAFSFLETWSKRQTSDVNHGSKTFKRKEREISVTRPVKTHVVEAVQKDERKTKATGSNVSSFGNRTRDSEIVKPTTEMKDKSGRQFEVIKTKHQSGGNNVDQNSFVKRSSTNIVDQPYDFKNPTFEAAKISSPVSLFQINKKNLDVDSSSEGSFIMKRSSSFHSKGSLKGGHDNVNTKNVASELEDSPFIEANHKENNRSKSPSEMIESESSDDDSPISESIILENHEGSKWSISPCQEEDSESSEDDSPIKVTRGGDCDKFDDSPEQDGFASAVKLFAVALERIQSKIHSTTSRQSAAILLSVSKNIHSRLHNAESKIQNEVGKLTNLGNSKKMHPENQCKEQQEQLKRIYEKFKEDVDQHLEKCRNTLEGLESHQIQVRGMVEKQRLSHTKFFVQTEEAIEKQLNDAQTRLTDVHRSARDQMHKLKFGIAECLKEGLLS